VFGVNAVLANGPRWLTQSQSTAARVQFVFLAESAVFELAGEVGFPVGHGVRCAAGEKSRRERQREQDGSDFHGIFLSETFRK
jgi:hypothetical protein